MLQADGLPLREHLKSVARQLNRKYETDVQCPPLLEYLWGHYVDLNNAKTGHAISYPEMLAWSELTRTRLTPFEVNVLKQIEAKCIMEAANVN